MLVASNLETVTQLKYRDQPRINQFGEDMSSEYFTKLNDSLASQDRANFRRILGLYFNLFEYDASVFAKETTKQFTLAPLSSLMAEEIDSMSHQRVL